MKKNVFSVFLLLGMLCLTTMAFAQYDQFAYAITDLQTKEKSWTVLRKLNLKEGKFSEVLLNGGDSNSPTYDAGTKKELQAAEAKSGESSQSPFGSGVAAMAYDRKNERVYFTPSDIDQLRYVDLKTMRVFCVTDQAFSKSSNLPKNEGKNISRMTITPEGIGYALSNDSSSFVRFTTGKKTEIQQLGSLTDDAEIHGVSLSNYCSCGGGDMVSDEEGNLYLFTGRNNVYKIDAKSNAATLIGYIKDLPKGFNTDGAVVTIDEKVLVSSASDNAVFLVDPKNWKATPYELKDSAYSSSDLANSNYLNAKPKEGSSVSDTEKEPIAQLNDIRLYPNPITDHRFNLELKKSIAGSYRLEIRNLMSAQLEFQKDLKIQGENQVETISIPSTLSGIYVVKIIGDDKTVIHTQKIVVQ